MSIFKIQTDRSFWTGYHEMRQSKFGILIDENWQKFERKKIPNSLILLYAIVSWIQLLFTYEKFSYIGNANWSFILDRLTINGKLKILHTHRWKSWEAKRERISKILPVFLEKSFLEYNNYLCVKNLYINDWSFKSNSFSVQ